MDLYNFNGASFDAGGMCLPPMAGGTPCTIPVTFTTHPGTFGSYSIINCDLDDGTEVLLMPLLLIHGLIAVIRPRRGNSLGER